MKNMALLQDILVSISPVDAAWEARAQKRLDMLTKPRGSLGRLEDLARKLCALMQEEKPQLNEKVIFVLASDHGIVAEGVSAYPQDVTWQMVLNFLQGGAAINVLSRAAQSRVRVVDAGVAKDFKPADGLIVKKINKGTSNFLQGPAMTREDAVRSVLSGVQLVENERENGGAHIIGTGEMGIGNTSAASAITAVITGKPVSEVTGRGTGLETDQLARKIHVIEKAIAVNKPDREDALDILSKIGGYEIGGLAGVILGAAKNKIPVMLDGFISGAAALIADLLSPAARPYLIAAHRSAEPGHDAILSHLGLKPLLDLGMRLGEGTGAALGMFLAECACRIFNEMATFEEAGVSEKDAE